MFQRFTSEEAENLMNKRPSQTEAALQMEKLQSLAQQASQAASLKEVATVREALLAFRAQLAPDDDTYDVVVDPMVDSQGVNLLCYCNLRLEGQEERAKQFLPHF